MSARSTSRSATGRGRRGGVISRISPAGEIAAYRRSLELDPGNANARAMLRELEDDGSVVR